MDFNSLTAIAPALIRAGVSVELRSAPGRGKSEWVRESLMPLMRSLYPDDDIGYHELFLATQAPPDLVGLPFKGEITFDGKRIAVTDPTAPTWFIDDNGRPLTSYKRGVLFLDEYGQGQADVKAASAELLLRKRIGKWQLPDGWLVVAASNRTSDRSGVTKSLDFVINRRVEIDITDDLASWETWAHKNNVEPLFVAFAAQNPHIVFSDGVPEKQGPWCTPRSLVLCSKIMSQLNPGGNIPTDPAAIELASGMIGMGAAQQLFAFVRLAHELPAFADIVADPDGSPVPQKPDAQMLAIYELAARVTEQTVAPVLKYVERFPKEFGATFARTTCMRVPELVMTVAFSDYCARNSSLINVLNAA